MHSAHPRIVEGSVFRWRPTYKYRAILTADVTVDLRKGYKGRHQWWTHGDSGSGAGGSSAGGQLIATLVDDCLTIHEGYASDLCSPAVRVAGCWIGTPTGPGEELAAFVHDCTRQLLGHPCAPWTRKDTDDLFYDFLGEGHSKVRRLYHFAVSSVIGSAFMALTRKDRSLRCRCHRK